MLYTQEENKEDECLLFGMDYLQDHTSDSTRLQQVIFPEVPVETHPVWDALEGKSHVAGVRSFPAAISNSGFFPVRTDETNQERVHRMSSSPIYRVSTVRSYTPGVLPAWQMTPLNLSTLISVHHRNTYCHFKACSQLACVPIDTHAIVPIGKMVQR